MKQHTSSVFQLLKNGAAAILAAGALTAGAQSPAGNTPRTVTNTPAAAVRYPGIHNLSDPGKFNYVRSILPDQPVQTLPGGSGYYYRQSAQYADGFGRPLQTVARKGHAKGNDLVSVNTYDSLGRESYQYLPYAAPTGGYFYNNTPAGWIKTNDSTQLRGFYDQAGPDEQPYSRTLFESSPLGRPVKVMAPGKGWVGSGRGKTFSYFTNSNWSFNNGQTVRTLSGGFPRFTIANNSNALPSYAGDYGYGQLNITQVIDEDGKEALEMKDNAGRTVIKIAGATAAAWGATRPADYAYTCYVYDDLGRQRAVLPPEAVRSMITSGPYGDATWAQISQSLMDGLCFSTFYDNRNRPVEKKIPGKDVEYYVYDKRDRPVFYQDGNLRKEGKWQFTLYDGLDRVTAIGITGFTGITVSGRTQLQGYLDQNAADFTDLLYYSWNTNLYNTYPPYNMPGCLMLAYYYYDDYTMSGSLPLPFNPSPFSGLSLPVTVVPSVQSGFVRGKLTLSRLRVLDAASPSQELWNNTAHYYDAKGREIQAVSNNYTGGTDISSNIYYFQGMLYKNILQHQNPKAVAIPGATDGPIQNYTLVNTYERNLALGGGSDLVSRHLQKINDGNEYEVSKYGYDHLGRNVTKQWPMGINLNAYNMRGFLDTIIFRKSNLDTAFYEALCYNKGFRDSLFNGNIAGITWAGANHIKRSYGYTYDALNRLTHAEFNEYTNGSWNKTAGNDFTMSNVTYDLNGNIRTMNQMGRSLYSTGSEQMDVLTYTYAPGSNRLFNVKDLGTVNPALPDFKDDAGHNDNSVKEYDFDPNGNMVADLNKGINSIAYNYLNKPEKIDVNGKGQLMSAYDAAGTLLRKIAFDKNGQRDTTDYAGPFVYHNSELQYILNEEGRARPILATHDSFPEVPEGKYWTKFVYDYFVKDHLGNVRSTVTARPATYPYLAMHNISTANIENLVFDHIEAVRDEKPGSAGPDDMAARLDGGDPQRRIGTAIMLQASPGDYFKLSAQAFYDGDYQQTDQDALPADELVQSLMGVLSQGGLIGGKVGEGLPDENIRLVQAAFSDPNLPGLLQSIYDQDNNPDAPRAHLTYLWFNDRLELDVAHSGAVQVTQAPNSWNTIIPVIGGGSSSGGSSFPWGTMEGDGGGTFVAPGTGFLVVYIDNQSIGKDVWFDNLGISHYQGNVLEETHYQPFGLTLNVTPMPAGINAQPYKLTTKELEKKFDLNMYDFEARMQDMQLGRWWQIDPLADKMGQWSPYSYCYNNPISFIDPDGRFGVQVTGQFLKENNIKDVVGFANYVLKQMDNLEKFSEDPKNKDVMMSISKVTGLKLSQVKEDFQSGCGPTIVLQSKNDESQDIHKNTITIWGAPMIEQYNASTSGDKEKEYYLGITNEMYIMHEYGHYGDKKTNNGFTTGQIDGAGLPSSTDPTGWQHPQSISGHRGSDIDNMILHGYYLNQTNGNSLPVYFQGQNNPKIRWDLIQMINKSRFGPFKIQ